MSSSLWENLWRMRILIITVGLHRFSHVLLDPIDVVVHRHEHDATLEVTRMYLALFFLNVVWTTWSSCIIVCPGEIFHSNTTVSPAMSQSSRYS